MAKKPDMVDRPPHYTRGPVIVCPHCKQNFVLECIEVIRYIGDMRLATAVKYIWRVGFGGKDDNRQDIKKSRWYLRDWLKHPLV